MNIENYDIKMHKHIVSVWSAATAANNSTKFRFPVEFGKKLLILATDSFLESEFIEYIESIRKIKTQELFDEWHDTTVCKMIEPEKIDLLIDSYNQKSKTLLVSSNYTYGIAAKLLNVYLKVYFLGEFNKGQFADFIHPPIDRLLLKQLRSVDKNLFSFSKNSFEGHKLTEGLPAWTQFTDQQYKNILSKIKRHLHDNGATGLWKVEYAWKGYQ